MSDQSPIRALSATLWGVDARAVHLTVLATDGATGFEIQGLGAPAARECRERVRAALRSCGFDIGGRSFLVHLSPVDLPKEAGFLDLAIALAILVAGRVLPQEALDDRLICGELGLDGTLRTVRGGIAIADLGRQTSARELLLPAASAAEAAALEALPVVGLRSLAEAVHHLRGEGPVAPTSLSADLSEAYPSYVPDLSEVRGQETAKRALEVAAAGGHNLLLIGPPGSGKTMLARRLPGLLPPLTRAEAIDVTRIHSLVAEEPPRKLLQHRPFRSPHTGTSTAGLLGGGSHPRPGEVSLAHNGVLFLDELPEFRRGTLDALRQPLELGSVTIVRSGARVSFPARFSLLAAMSACPCGHRGDARYSCTCPTSLLERYRSRVSGPLLDSIDLHVEMPAVSLKDLRSGPGECTAEVARRVAVAREIQRARYGIEATTPTNAALGPEQLQRFCTLDGAGREILDRAFQNLGLSARARDRVLKVARTIADLAGSESVRAAHIAEAIQYRCLDLRSEL